MKLVLDNLTKEFGEFVAVDHINLTMTNGVYGLLGIACAIPARLFIPPDNFFNFLFATFASPTLEINSFVLFLATA